MALMKGSGGKTLLNSMVSMNRKSIRDRRSSIESGIETALFLLDKKQQAQWKKDICKEFPWVPNRKSIRDRRSSIESGIETALFLLDKKQLGWKAETTGQNFKNTKLKSAGWSSFGDYNNKQARTFLTDAANSQNCHFVCNCEVERVLYDTTNTATGVIARIYDEKKKYRLVTLKAKRAVVLSAGSLHSPCILLCSKLQNSNIGKHLHLHPVSGVIGNFSSDKEIIKLYEGAPMTSVCKVNTMINNGYGALMEVPSAHPGLMGASVPWNGGYDAIQNLLSINSLAAILVLQRDHGSGTIQLSSTKNWWQRIL
eukprot:CAMPEP_0194162352 /NCGR_PEP_ID=MMETSP0152-20130528/79451_1 /TAXON_ID=1049557 /ORGANISM="Thalassiothrix antarctica, Strain L6-D1" /LENGTH=311 /DNA_ID=CAMNT_0038872245 /DNA_START=270 /DNA_END=1202 /DNA_ORIENTATION=+